MKMTKWFSPEVKPVRNGIYRTDFMGLDDLGYSHWNGRKWSAEWGSVARARKGAHTYGNQNKRWRGLATPPKVSQ